MGIQGKLTKAKMGWAMPVDAPAYGPPPGYFQRSRFLRFDFETDGDLASEIVPEQLTLLDPPTAGLMFAENTPGLLPVVIVKRYWGSM